MVEVSILKQGNSLLLLRILGLGDQKLLFVIYSQVLFLSLISCFIGILVGIVIANFIIVFFQGNLGAGLSFQNTSILEINYMMLITTFFIGLASSLLAPLILSTKFKKI